MSQIGRRIRQAKQNFGKYPLYLSDKQTLAFNFGLLISSATLISFVFFVINLLLPMAGPKMTLDQINNSWLPYAIIWSGVIMGWSMYMLIRYAGKTEHDLVSKSIDAKLDIVISELKNLTNEIRLDRIERNKKS